MAGLMEDSFAVLKDAVNASASHTSVLLSVELRYPQVRRILLPSRLPRRPDLHQGRGFAGDSRRLWSSRKAYSNSDSV